MISIEKSSNFTDKVRLLTFQSKEVLEILLRDGSYLSDSTKSRERRDYKEDIAQLNGANPIWGFSPIGLSSIKIPDKFIREDFLDGSKFERFKCEMSLNGNKQFNNYYLLEIELDKSLIKPGITHNAYIGAVVFPELKIENLVAVYQLFYSAHWYFPEVKVLQLLKPNPLFPENFTCEDED